MRPSRDKAVRSGIENGTTLGLSVYGPVRELKIDHEGSDHWTVSWVTLEVFACCKP